MREICIPDIYNFNVELSIVKKILSYPCPLWGVDMGEYNLILAEKSLQNAQKVRYQFDIAVLSTAVAFGIGDVMA